MPLWTIIDFLVLPSLDRIGGSFWKAARRYGIPVYLIARYLILGQLNVTILAFLVTLGIIFSLNLDEIEDRNWDEIGLYSLSMAFCLWHVAGWWAFLPGNVWMAGIYWSNFGIFGHKLNWRWVEVGRGLATAACINL